MMKKIPISFVRMLILRSVAAIAFTRAIFFDTSREAVARHGVAGDMKENLKSPSARMVF